jgi:hypothetical protein
MTLASAAPKPRFPSTDKVTRAYETANTTRSSGERGMATPDFM